ncbi:hypothetical protein [Variovorax paradoxus]|uniref:hypothetical protein n=1 Tax=Variovorax paradoxus TaxID=34073 RepID=UPI00285E3DB3|nr:hypothetical protein [Variovorax paradoxus]MDR6455474.1 hypothetical protein [Variovorax paradoxus]
MKDSFIDLARYAGTYGGYRPDQKSRWRIGLLFQQGGLWIGAHWSSYERRWCVNLLPCVTIWIMLPGGRPPRATTRGAA